MWLWRISLGDGKFGPIGLDLRLSKTSSKVLPDVVAVASDVFMVLTCLSMNPLDLGYCGEEVICSTLCVLMN